MKSSLNEYKTIQAWLVWILFFFIVYVLLKRYDLIILLKNESFLSGVFSRFWTNYLYGIIGMAFLGSLAYATCLFVILTSRINFLKSAAKYFSGIPQETKKNDTFINGGGYELAISPLLNAAALFPGLGFLGTVIGISLSIDGLGSIMEGQSPDKLISGLRTAFDTTFLGLIAALSLTLINMGLTQTITKQRNASSSNCN